MISQACISLGVRCGGALVSGMDRLASLQGILLTRPSPSPSPGVRRWTTASGHVTRPTLDGDASVYALAIAVIPITMAPRTRNP